MSELFNCKVIQYANGITEIRKYSRVIGDGKVNQTKEQFTKSVELGKRQAFFRTHEYVTPDDCPFIDEPTWMGIFPDELEKLEHFRLYHNRRVSFNRTVNEIYKISRQCNWEYFITLTFDKEKVDRYDYSLCMKKANTWFNNQRKRKAFDLQYLFVPEQHKDGAWHIHGLIAQVGVMSFADSGKKEKGKIVYNLDGWKFGFSTATRVDDVNKVSTYITKYITKELCDVTKGKKRYFRSQNIPEPVERTLILENDNDIQTIADSLGIELDFEKTVNGYVDVNYKYYKEFEREEN